MTRFGTEAYDPKPWVGEYISESKRPLTGQRSTTARSLLAEVGPYPA